MEQRDYILLIGVMAVGAALGAIAGGLAALATGFMFLTVFGGVAGSYLGMVYADWHWGPRSRKVRRKRADEERRRVGEAETAARRAAVVSTGVNEARSRRAARKAAARTRR